MKWRRGAMPGVILLVLLITGCGVTDPSTFAGEWTCLWIPLLQSSEHQVEVTYIPISSCQFQVDAAGHAAVSDTIGYRTAPVEAASQIIQLELTGLS